MVINIIFALTTIKSKLKRYLSYKEVNGIQNKKGSSFVTDNDKLKF